MKFKVTIGLCAIVLGFVLFLVSPYFGAREIIITGNTAVASAEIHERLEMTLGVNILLFNTAAARRRIMENLYIDSVGFSRTLPGRVYVNVRERRVIGYIEHSPGSFLFVDETGRVLEVRSNFTEPLPVVTGLPVTSFQLGERLEVPVPAVFSTVAQYAMALQWHGLATFVTHIDVSDPLNVRILFPNIEFNVGDAHNADEKVRVMTEILLSLPNVASYRGFMDLREITDRFFFTILT
jgi:hypothetical protein